MVKKVLIFLMSVINVVYLASMEEKKSLSFQETIMPMPKSLKEVIPFIQEGSIDEAIFCISSLSLNVLNSLYEFEAFGSSYDRVSKNQLIKGYSLVHIAVFYNRWELIETLYTRGANLLLQSSQETGLLTPFDLARQKKHWECASEIVKYVPD